MGMAATGRLYGRSNRTYAGNRRDTPADRQTAAGEERSETVQLTKTRLKEKLSKLEEVKRLAAIGKALLASPRRDIVREIDGAHFGDQTIGRRLTGRWLETRHDAARMGRDIVRPISCAPA
jgi:hypothetical protein